VFGAAAPPVAGVAPVEPAVGFAAAPAVDEGEVIGVAPDPALAAPDVAAVPVPVVADVPLPPVLGVPAVAAPVAGVPPVVGDAPTGFDVLSSLPHAPSATLATMAVDAQKRCNFMSAPGPQGAGAKILAAHIVPPRSWRDHTMRVEVQSFHIPYLI
jgi:hypothetical protein